MKAIRRAAIFAGVSALLTTSAMAAPIQWTIASGGNDHWYEFFAGPVTWDVAFSNANAATHLGLQGYLATVTSAEENRFVSATVAGGAVSWLGASDGGNEGNWTWRNGPENGAPLTYTNWNLGEPNDCCGGEDFLQTNWDVALGWNDLGGPGVGADFANGYVVEYSAAPSAVPAPGSLALLLTAALAGAAALRRHRAG